MKWNAARRRYGTLKKAVLLMAPIIGKGLGNGKNVRVAKYLLTDRAGWSMQPAISYLERLSDDDIVSNAADHGFQGE